jgi:MFS family permease
MNTRRYSLIVIAGLCVSLLLLSFASTVIVVVIAFYGLRLFGQGLMSHTSISSMALYFKADRGKAIVAASLGYSAGEAVLPILIALLIGSMSWRGALHMSALSCIVVVAPLVLLLLHLSKTRIRAYRIQKHTSKKQQKAVHFTEVIKQKKFWIISPIVFIIGFTNTAVFFFQLKLGEARGWSPEWVAASISAFAIAGAVGMTGIGSLVDRFTGLPQKNCFLFI